jgi:hypothetical protein
MNENKLNSEKSPSTKKYNTTDIPGPYFAPDWTNLYHNILKITIFMTVANMYVMSSFAIRWSDNRNQLIEDCKRLLMYNNNKINNNTSSWLQLLERANILGTQN